MNFKKTYFLLLLLVSPIVLSAQWTQISNAIDGESANDQSGFSVSLSADGNTVAIGARNNDDNGSASGHIRVYENNVNVWQQKGSDIDGIEVSDQFGFSVSISADGNTIAIGAPDNNATGFESGHVRVYAYQANDWVIIGNAIEDGTFGDHTGYSVSLSDDGNRLAVGAPDDGDIADVGSNYGIVRVYENQSGNWVQIGNNIWGEAAEDNSGASVSLNNDGSIVAIGAPNNNNSFSGAGHARVFAFQTNNWVQIGQDLEGEGQNDQYGGAVSINNQGNIVAIGATHNNGIGHVRVFEFITSSWVQIGSDIDGEAVSDEFGISVSLNGDGDILAVGARYNSGFTLDAGHTRVYRNQSSNWVQIDSDIDGEALQDRSGYSVSLNADGSIVAIGSYLNDGVNGSNSGHVRLFSNANVLNIKDVDSSEQFNIYPNPATTQIHIYLKKVTLHSKIELYNIQGKLLHTEYSNNINSAVIDIANLSKGIYILKLELDKSYKTLKVIKR